MIYSLLFFNVCVVNDQNILLFSPRAARALARARQASKAGGFGGGASTALYVQLVIWLAAGPHSGLALDMDLLDIG